MARHPRDNTGTVPVYNRFSSTLPDRSKKSASIVDAVLMDLGTLVFRGFEAGNGIEIDVVDADDGRFSAREKKIVIRNTGPGLGDLDSLSNIQKVSSDLLFKRINAGQGISIGDDGDSLTIQVTEIGEDNAAVSLGGTEAVYAGKDGANLQFKGLTAGSNVELSSDDTAITISVPEIGEINTASNLGDGEEILVGKNGVDFQFRTLVAGENIGITTDENTIVITNTDATSVTNLGDGEGLYFTNDGAELQFKGLVAGDNITLTPTDTSITISSENEVATASNVGDTGEGVFKQKAGTNFEFKKLRAGNNTSLTSDTNSIIISAVGTIIGAANLDGALANVYSEETNRTLQFRGIRAGTNTTVTSDQTAVIISAVGEIASASNLGTGQQVFKQKTGSNLEFRSISAGAGIDVSADANHVIVTSTGDPVTVVNLDDGTSGAVGIFKQKEVSELQFKSLRAGPDILITDEENEIVIESTVVPGETNTVSNIGVAGVGVFKQKTGVNFELKKINAGSNKIAITDDTANNEIDIDVVPGNITTSSLNNDAGFKSNLSTFTTTNLTEGDNLYWTQTRFNSAFGAKVLNDLLDVNVGTPGAGQHNYLLQWDNNSGKFSLINSTLIPGVSGMVTDGANVGSTGIGTAGVFRTKNGANLEFRRINAGPNISITEQANQIDISAINVGETNTASNVGGGEEVYKTKEGSNLVFRTLAAGNNIAVNTNGNSIQISAINVGDVDSGLNLGSGAKVFESESNRNLRFRSLVSTNNNLIITESATEISFNSLGEDNTASSIGTGVGFTATKVGEDLQFKSLKNTHGTVISSTADEVRLVSGEINSFANIGVINPTPPEPDPLVSYDCGVYNGLVNDPTYPTLKTAQFLSLRGGSGITLRKVGSNIIINNRYGTGEPNTASNTAGGVGIFKNKVAIDLVFKSLVAGTGITLTPTDDNIEIINSGTIASLDFIDNVNVGEPGAEQDQHVLIWDNTSGAFILKAEAVGGPEAAIQFNNEGLQDGDPNFLTDGAGNIGITGSLVVDDIVINGDSIVGLSGIVIDPGNSGFIVAPVDYNLSAAPAEAFATKSYVDSKESELVVDSNNEMTIGDVVYTGKTVDILLNNQQQVDTSIQYNADYRAAFVDYGIVRGTNSRAGTLVVINNGTEVSITDHGTNIGSLGVVFTAEIVEDVDHTNLVVIRYTTTHTGSDATMYYTMRRLFFEE